MPRRGRAKGVTLLWRRHCDVTLLVTMGMRRTLEPYLQQVLVLTHLFIELPSAVRADGSSHREETSSAEPVQMVSPSSFPHSVLAEAGGDGMASVWSAASMGVIVSVLSRGIINDKW